MSSLLTVVLAASLAALSIAALAGPLRRGRWLLVAWRAGLLALLLVALNALFDFPFPLRARDSSPEAYWIVALYLAMLLGMVAHAAHDRYSVALGDRPPFDVGTFFAPILTSPIVFIPLFAALQNAEVDLQRLDAARMMLFFVACENGFFWRDYYNNRVARPRASTAIGQT